MIKLNDDSIIVGQIKQTLHNFNLPKCPIIKDDNNYTYYQGYGIKDNSIYLRKNNNWERVNSYTLNKSYLNITDNLTIKSKYYDINTHIYLGKYLRFIKDYYSVDLMGMYNCSIDKTLNDDVVFNQTINGQTKSVEWKHEDNNIYIVPIYFDNTKELKYTIYTDEVAEVALTLFNIDTDELITSEYIAELRNELFYKSFKKIYCQSKDKPYLYTVFVDDKNKFSPIKDDNKTLCKYKDNMCLLIKLPKNYQGQLIVLEGDFTKNSVYQININNNSWRTIDLIPYITTPQLLSNDNNNNYVLADKLIQYLTKNAISPLSEPYDILKLQNWFNTNAGKMSKLTYSILVEGEEKETTLDIKTLPTNGYWSGDLTYNLIQLYYYYINTPKYKKKYYDFIGYVDSNMEELFEDADNVSIKDPIYDYGGII